MFSNVVIVGRIANGLELKQAGNGKVADVSIAVQNKQKNADGTYKTNFYKCELWNKRAEQTVDYFKVGDMVSIVGSLDIDTYEKDGIKREVYKIIPDSFSLVTPAKEKNIAKEQEQSQEDMEMDICD